MPRPRKKPRDAYHHGDLHTAILAAAEAIVHSEGSLALSVRSVALRLGVSHAAIYHHFKDRNDMVASVAERGFERLGEAMDVATIGAENALLHYKQQGL